MGQISYDLCCARQGVMACNASVRHETHGMGLSKRVCLLRYSEPGCQDHRLSRLKISARRVHREVASHHALRCLYTSAYIVNIRCYRTHTVPAVRSKLGLPFWRCRYPLRVPLVSVRRADTCCLSSVPMLSVGAGEIQAPQVHAAAGTP